MSLEVAIAENTQAIRELIAAIDAANMRGVSAPVETKPAKKEPEAKKPQADSASDSTPKSSPAPSEPPPEDAKAYSYDDVKALIVKLASPTGGIADGRAKAVALLGRFGMKVLPKDADADTLALMGALAEATIAGEVDPRDAVEA